jgi:hypothetical protein
MVRKNKMYLKGTIFTQTGGTVSYDLSRSNDIQNLRKGTDLLTSDCRISGQSLANFLYFLKEVYFLYVLCLF